MKLIDLSVTVNSNTPVFPGDPHVKIEKVNFFEKGSFEDHQISLGNHVGTHIDAPSHMVEGGKNLKDFPIEKFVARTVCLDVREGFSLDEVKKTVPGVEAVLFYTGMSQKYGNEQYFEDFPTVPTEVAQYLSELSLKMVGVDTCSVDGGEPFEGHKILLGRDILLIENLTNLEKLLGKKFKLYAFPLKLEIDGAPARVVAELPQ
jgi:kynurenine formamidase